MRSNVERVKSSLQIEENISLHMTGWIVQRIGWALMLAFLICATLGLFGDGVLSEETLAQGTATVTFEKFTRRESNTEVEILATATSGTLRLVLPPVFLESFKIEKVEPEPSEEKTRNGSAIYEFQCEGQGRVTLFLITRKAGSVRSSIHVDNTAFDIQQFIYP